LNFCFPHFEPRVACALRKSRQGKRAPIGQKHTSAKAAHAQGFLIGIEKSRTAAQFPTPGGIPKANFSWRHSVGAMRRVVALMPYTANDPQAQNRNAAFLQGLQQFGRTVRQTPAPTHRPSEKKRIADPTKRCNHHWRIVAVCCPELNDLIK
jgi:hypothetical protein